MTLLVSCTIRLSTGDSADEPGLCCVDANIAPSGQRTPGPGPPRVCVCVPFFAGSGGLASRAHSGAPNLFLWPCMVRSLFARAHPGWGCPFFLFSLCAPVVSGVPWFPAQGPWALASCCPPFPPPFFFPALPLAFVVVCFPPPLSLAFRVFRPGVPLALAPCCPPAPAPFFCFFPPCLFFFPAFHLFLGFFCFAGCAVRGWFLSPGLSGVPVCALVVLSLSLFLVRCSPAPLTLAGVVWCCLLCLGVCCWAWLSSVVSWWVLVSCFGGVFPFWPPGAPPCGLVWCVLVFRCPVLCSVALCCRVVVCCCALLVVCVVACACCLFPAAARLLCVFWGAVLCVPCPLRPVWCCAALCWCPCVVLSASSVLFLVPGAVGSWCRCLFLGFCWWLWLPGVVVWRCLSVLVPVSVLAVVPCLPCGVLLPCVVSCGAVLPSVAVLWCPVVFFFFICLAGGAGFLSPL